VVYAFFFNHETARTFTNVHEKELRLLAREASRIEECRMHSAQFKAEGKELRPAAREADGRGNQMRSLKAVRSVKAKGGFTWLVLGR